MDASSCGPSSALANLSKHTQRDNTLQNEYAAKNAQLRTGPAGFRQNGNAVDARLNAEFHNFQGNGLGAEFPAFAGTPSFQQQAQHLNQQQFQPNNAGWVQDFSGLSISNQPQQVGHPQSDWHQQFLQQQQHHHQQQQFEQQNIQQGQQFAPNYALSAFSMNMRTNLSTPLYAQQQVQTGALLTEHQEIHKMEQEKQLFDSHFDQLEKELNQQLQEKPEVEVQVDKVENEQFAETARQIENSLRQFDTADAATKAKIENSDFLKLMSSISNKQVVLDGDKLVDSTGQDIRENVNEPLQQISRPDYHDPIHDIPVPVRPITRNPAQAEIQQEARPEQINKLPDPLSHMQDGLLGDVYDALSAAKVVSGGQVKTGDWVDEDDEWLDMTTPSISRPKKASIMADHWQEVYDDYRNDDDFH